MASHLQQIKIISLAASVLDDGPLTQLSTKYGEAKVKLQKMQKKKAGEAEVKKQEALVKKAKAALEKAKKEFGASLAMARAAGVFKFRRKVYVNDKLYKGIGGPRPAHKLKWVRHTSTNDYREYQTYLANQWTPVDSTKDPYWPEGIVADAEHHFKFGDAILMKKELKAYIVGRLEDLALSEGARDAELRRFRNQVEAEGGVVPDDEVEKALKIIGR